MRRWLLVLLQLLLLGLSLRQLLRLLLVLFFYLLFLRVVSFLLLQSLVVLTIPSV